MTTNSIDLSELPVASKKPPGEEYYAEPRDQLLLKMNLEISSAQEQAFARFCRFSRTLFDRSNKERRRKYIDSPMTDDDIFLRCLGALEICDNNFSKAYDLVLRRDERLGDYAVDMTHLESDDECAKKNRLNAPERPCPMCNYNSFKLLFDTKRYCQECDELLETVEDIRLAKQFVKIAPINFNCLNMLCYDPMPYAADSPNSRSDKGRSRSLPSKQPKNWTMTRAKLFMRAYNPHPSIRAKRRNSTRNTGHSSRDPIEQENSPIKKKPDVEHIMFAAKASDATEIVAGVNNLQVTMKTPSAASIPNNNIRAKAKMLCLVYSDKKASVISKEFTHIFYDAEIQIRDWALHAIKTCDIPTVAKDPWVPEGKHNNNKKKFVMPPEYIQAAAAWKAQSTHGCQKSTL